MANILGTANELLSFLYNSPNTEKSRNMDLWNNAVGRRYGKKTRTAHTLAKALAKAIEAGELILSLDDERIYSDYVTYKVEPQKPVIVLKQSPSGRNEAFFDLISSDFMRRAQFVRAIEKGKYPGYRIARYYGIPTPVSCRDGQKRTNLG